MALTPSKLRQINDCLDRISKRLDEAEARRAREDSEDRRLEEELAEGNTMPVAPSAPCADTPPEKIHGEGREDQVESLWPPQPRVPVPTETL
jgi:hypothetical protein